MLQQPRHTSAVIIFNIIIAVVWYYCFVIFRHYKTGRMRSPTLELYNDTKSSEVNNTIDKATDESRERQGGSLILLTKRSLVKR